jgi:hypothetical protein
MLPQPRPVAHIQEQGASQIGEMAHMSLRLDSSHENSQRAAPVADQAGYGGCIVALWIKIMIPHSATPPQ